MKILSKHKYHRSCSYYERPSHSYNTSRGTRDIRAESSNNVSSALKSDGVFINFAADSTHHVRGNK